MPNNFWHPTIAFFVLAVALPVLRRTLPWAVLRYVLLVPALVAIFAVFTMAPGIYAHAEYLSFPLTFGRVDALSLIFANVFAVQALIGFIYGMHLDDIRQQMAAAFYVGGAFGCVFAGDYLTLFIFWEIMSVASTMLIMFNSRENPRAAGAGLRYFLVHTAGGLLLLAGMLLRFKATGTMAFTPADTHGMELYDWLILLGFGVNSAFPILHAWLPDAYPEATVTGAVFMSAFTTKTAVYVLARAFAGVEALGWIGLTMALWGVLYATMENNARRILSYHIMSQVGYMVAGIGIGTAMTLNGACAHAYAHILYKGLLFMTVGSILYATGTANLDRLGGLVGRFPLVMLAYMVAGLSISGMPLFNGFVSKTMTIAGAFEHHQSAIGLGLEIAAVGTFLSVGLKLPYFAFWGGRDAPKGPLPNAALPGGLRTIPGNMLLAMAISATLCILQGIYPQMLYQYLPFPVEYHPWTPYNVLQALMLLGFTGLGFMIIRSVLKPHAQRNLDFELLYMAIGKVFMAVVSRPIEWIDGIWSEVYRVVGLRGLMLQARAAAIFDKRGIDTVVDGTAYTTLGIGRLTARMQTGRLQDYLAMALAIGMAALALFVILGRGM